MTGRPRMWLSHCLSEELQSCRVSPGGVNAVCRYTTFGMASEIAPEVYLEPIQFDFGDKSEILEIAVSSFSLAICPPKLPESLLSSTPG